MRVLSSYPIERNKEKANWGYVLGWITTLHSVEWDDVVTGEEKRREERGKAAERFRFPISEWLGLVTAISEAKERSLHCAPDLWTLPPTLSTVLLLTPYSKCCTSVIIAPLSSSPSPSSSSSLSLSFKPPIKSQLLIHLLSSPNHPPHGLRDLTHACLFHIVTSIDTYALSLELHFWKRQQTNTLDISWDLMNCWNIVLKFNYNYTCECIGLFKPGDIIFWAKMYSIIAIVFFLFPPLPT